MYTAQVYDGSSDSVSDVQSGGYWDTSGFGQLYDMINAQQQANNAWSAEQAQNAMDWQERMSNTAHQREVKDLIAAGLNPVLSAGGQGATTGTGHAANAGNENVSALYSLISKTIDAQMEQAAALNNTAKAVSGTLPETAAVPMSLLGNPILDALFNVGADVLYRKYGIRQEDLRDLVQQVSTQTAGAADTLRGLLGSTGLSSNEVDALMQAAGEVKPSSQSSRTSEKKIEKKIEKDPISSISKNQEKILTSGAAAAIVALIAKGLGGGSAKKETFQGARSYTY